MPAPQQRLIRYIYTALDQERTFVELVEANQGIVHKVCRMYADTEAERQDLFQEILLQLWRAYPKFRGEARFTTWMYRVSLNTAVTQFRRKKRRPEGSPLSEEIRQLADQPADTETEEQLQLLRTAIDQLSQVERAIVMLYLEEKPTEEIAEIVGITANYVRVKMNRIRIKLRKLMKSPAP